MSKSTHVSWIDCDERGGLVVVHAAGLEWTFEVHLIDWCRPIAMCWIGEGGTMRVVEAGEG